MTDPARIWFERRQEMLGHLAGRGIEIGALHQPVHAPHLEVAYVDRIAHEELRVHYEELSEQPLVPIDIIDDAQTLATIGDASQDFVIANNVIEHMSNPIAALLAWQRVLRPGGRLYMSVPDMRHTFDSERPLTTTEHLVADFERPSGERDRAAFEEFALEVSSRKLGVCPVEEAGALATRMWDAQYSIHYHVWTDATFAEFLHVLPDYTDAWCLTTVDHAPTLTNEFVYVLEKPA